jgi:hypothetical protein
MIPAPPFSGASPVLVAAPGVAASQGDGPAAPVEPGEARDPAPGVLVFLDPVTGELVFEPPDEASRQMLETQSARDAAQRALVQPVPVRFPDGSVQLKTPHLGTALHVTIEASGELRYSHEAPAELAGAAAVPATAEAAAATTAVAPGAVASDAEPEVAP